MVTARWSCLSLALCLSPLLPAQNQLFDASKFPASSEPSRASVPNTPLPPEKRADILMARKMYREAADTYKQGPSDSAVVQNKIGIAYHQMMEMELARKYYERSIRLDSKYPEAINNLGTVFYAKKKYRHATNLYRKALRLSPKSASIYSNLGTALFARKNYKGAADAYRQALVLDKDVFEHHSSWGVLLQERSVEERAKFHFYLAKTYAHAGMNERALMYIRKALEEGFTERQRLMDDPEFASVRELPEFQELIAAEPRVL